jgi:hypothetical protein
MLRHVREERLLARSAAWLRRLRSTTSKMLPAQEVYAGDHWAIARSLPVLAQRRGFDARLWIISTGYGLISASTPIAGYSATFSPTHPDSVCPNAYGLDAQRVYGEWWQRLSRWRGPVPGEPRSLKELAEHDPRAVMLVVASAAYLAAVSADLEGATATLKRRGMLLVVSGGTRREGPLKDVLLPLDARMQAQLGGARRSLNIRMARNLLKGLSPNDCNAVTIIARQHRVLARTAPLTITQRIRSTDQDVQTFICRHLQDDSSATATALLRQYRAAGYACEQSRFCRLFNCSRKERHA